MKKGTAGESTAKNAVIVSGIHFIYFLIIKKEDVVARDLPRF